MNPDPKHIEHIGIWLRSQLSGFNIESGLVERPAEGVFFRARSYSGGTPLELEVSLEAFEDYLPEQLIADLERLRAVDRLRKHPDVRLRLDNLHALKETDRHS